MSLKGEIRTAYDPKYPAAAQRADPVRSAAESAGHAENGGPFPA